MSTLVLLIHRNELVRRLLTYVLETHNYVVMSAATSEDSLLLLQQTHPAVLPDVLIVDGEGLLSVLSPNWRKKWPEGFRQPVLVIDEGLEMNLPASILSVSSDPRDLLLKLKALQRFNPESDQVLERQGLKLDPSSQEAFAGHLRLNLTPLSFRLLYFLMKHPGRVYSREQLLDQVWKDQGYVEERTVDVHVYRLRNQLARYGYGDLIEAVRGSGYRFVPEVVPANKQAVKGLRFAS